MTTFNKALKYLLQRNNDYLAENEDDHSELFSKLVMFHQLKSVSVWDLFKKLHQTFRKQTQTNDDAPDSEKANRFILAMCPIMRDDLTPFFKKWGITPNPATAKIIRDLRLPPLAVDPSPIFK
ncbi:MAG: M60 family metallopeptidase [Pyrinomonadaceae bacterium]|nr:M60 family metallopeptidase [Pyrinomonadaceae bacterium]